MLRCHAYLGRVQAADELPSTDIREARLRADAALLYPKLVPERWVTASALIAVAMRERERNGFPWRGTGRPLLDQHFEFRGGTQRGRASSIRGTRLGDA